MATGLLALVTVLPARADYPSTVLSYSPAAYWRLNESGVHLLDITPATNSGSLGSTLNGSYVNPYTRGTTGALAAGTDTATAFAVNGYLTIPNNSIFNGTNFSAEIWYKPDSNPATGCALSRADWGGGRFGWVIYTIGSTWNLRLFDGIATANAISISSANYTIGAWHHVVATFDGITAKLYVNGVLEVSGTFASGKFYAPPTTVQNLTISKRNDNNFGTAGSADETAFYTNVLSGSAVAAHYAAGTNSALNAYASTVLADGPVGYWRLNEPVWTAPSPPYPTAVNSGTLAPTADGTYSLGINTLPNGPGYSGLGGANVGAFYAAYGAAVNCGINIPGLVDPTITNTTLMAWFKMPAAKTMNYQTLLSCGDDAWVISRGGSGNNGFEVQWNGQNPRLLSTRTINDDQWHHVAVVASSNNVLSIYIDGRLDVTGVRTVGSRTEATYPILIGNNGKYAGTANDRAWSGGISDVAVFTSALSASDIATIYGAAVQIPTIQVAAAAAPTNYVYEAENVTLSVTAAGLAPLAYRWTKNGTNISGASARTYSLPSVGLSDNGTYAVIVTNTIGAVTSSVTLTVVGSAPTIITQPASVTAYVGNTATFSVGAGGSLPRTYQWKHGTSPIAGATTASLILPNIQWAAAGSYTCGITNAYGGTNTATATLTIGGQFASTVLPEITGRDRHTALGSDGTNLFFTLGNTASAGFYRIAEGASSGWTTLAPIPLSSTVNNDSGVGELGYLDGALWTLARNPDLGGPRCVFRYDLAGNSWAYGGGLPGDGPNAAIAVVATNKIIGGWIGWDEVRSVTDWVAGSADHVANIGGGAAHPWAACVGPDNVYMVKHYNQSASVAHEGVLVTINKVGTPAYTNITGLPFNPGIGCAVEYMPGSLFPDTHARLYVLSGGTGTADGDGGSWTAEAAANQLAVYDLVSKSWSLQSLPFAVDLGSDMCLVNQTLYILAANSDSQPLKMLHLGPAVTPTITQQPVAQTIYLGQSVPFSVSANGGGPYTYQWRLAGANIAGATDSSYAANNAWYTNGGSYEVIVANSAGSVTGLVATLSVLLYPPTYANLTNDLVLHLTFDTDTTTDTSGRGNNATEGGLPTLVAGKLGNAVQLSTDTTGGTYNYLTVPDLNSDFQFEATNSFTIAFWLKYTTNFSDLPIIGNAGNSSYNPGFVLTEDGNQFEWTLTTDGGGQVVADPAGGPILNDGAWHQVTLVVDRSAQVAGSYVDGALIDSRSVGAVGSLITGNILAIGQDPTGAYGVSGTFALDDLGIWKRALSPTEAESIYMVAQSSGRSFDSFVRGSLALQKSGSNLQLIWEAGTLQWADSPEGAWTDVPNAGPSFYQLTAASYAKKFFRVKF